MVLIQWPNIHISDYPHDLVILAKSRRCIGQKEFRIFF
jgi:hypothetical protein